MTRFTRKFDVDCVEELVDAPENLWFRDLLAHWSPAGDCPNGSEPKQQADHLRIAVRNGYLNFYRAGQSVAKVRIVRGKLQAEIHRKYVFGKDCQTGTKYVLVSDGSFTDPHGASVAYRDQHLRSWIQAASDKDYAKEEKRFVDKLVALNPGVIDLEAGLPWDSEIWKDKSARRIDLVALEGCGPCYRLVFWEAKLATNSEARSKTVPRVIEQLERYERWLAKNTSYIRAAYQCTCAVLVRLHGIAKTWNPNICELGDEIVSVAGQDASELGIDTRPRLIIDAETENVAFMDNGHFDKLVRSGIEVQLVRQTTGMALRARA